MRLSRWPEWPKVCVLAVVAGAVLPGRTEAPAANGFYVWQRQWSEKVERAVDAELAAGTHDLYVLGGELEYENGRGRWQVPEVPKRLWRHARVTAVFRIPVKALDDAAKTAEALAARVQALGVCRVQLDADVPERRLARYAELLEDLRARWPREAEALKLGATFLPCHLDRKEVRRVLAALDAPVIQLHGLDAPKRRSEPWALMDRKAVFRALRAARALDGRFKMALPTYAYVLTFNPDGGFRRLYAEGFPDDFDLPPGVSRAIAAPDLDLLQAVFSSPLKLPAVWFRLPVRGVDRWGLERETMSILERGERPVPTVEFSVRTSGRTGVIDIVACYRHQIPLVGVEALLDWGACGAAGEFFPLNGCRVGDDTAFGRLPKVLHLVPFACGEPFAVAKAITSIDPKKVSVKIMEKQK